MQDPLKTFETIDQICDRFEQQWRAGEMPKIAAYLLSANEVPADELLQELLLVEVECRRSQGEHVAVAHYLECFPEHRETVQRVFDGLDGGRETTSANLDQTIGPTPREQPANHPSLTAGMRLGVYDLLAKIGQGGMGSVWKAKHTKLDKLVALKVLPPNLTGNPEAISRFEREMRAVGKLEHPHIVRAMDAGEFAGLHFLVMEYIEGEDLQRTVTEFGPRTAIEACEMVRQAALGLAHAHGYGLIHRDIKPSNLLLSKQGQVKILDLGLARLQEEGTPDTPALTTLGVMMGTPDFMAPEQWESSHRVGPAADLYALGCTLFFLITGRPPFEDEHHTSVLQKMKAHALEEPPRLSSLCSGVPEDVDQLCQQLLAKHPGQRLATASDLAAKLQAIIQGYAAATARPSSIAPLEEVTVHHHEPTSVTTTKQTRGLHKPRPSVWIASGALLLLVALLWAAAQIIFRVDTKSGTIVVEIDQPDAEGAEVFVDDQKRITLRAGKDQEPIRIEADEKERLLKVTKAGFDTFAKSFKVEAGKTTAIRVRLERKEPSKSLPDQPFVASGRDYQLRFDGDQSCVTTPITKSMLGLLEEGKSCTFEAYVTPEKQSKWAMNARVPTHYSGVMGVYQVSSVLFNGKQNLFALHQSGTSHLKLGQTFHIAAVWDGKEYHLFVNGKRQPNGGQVATSSIDGRFSFGGWYGDFINNAFCGSIDEVRLSTIARYTEDFEPLPRFDSDAHTLALYHCDEGNGTVLRDESGHGHHAMIVGAQWVDRGTGEALGHAAPSPRGKRAGSALEFRGRSYVDIPELTYQGGPITFEAWACHPNDLFRFYNLSPTVMELDPFRLKVYYQGPRYEWLVYRPSPREFAVASSEESSVVSSSWIHLAGQWDGRQLTLYVNGKRNTLHHTHKVTKDARAEDVYEIVEALVGLHDGRSTLNIGGGSHTTQWIGFLDEMRVSNKARYGADFVPVERFEPDEYTLALYHCDEAEGETLLDASGNKHHGRILGESWAWAYSPKTGGDLVQIPSDEDPQRELAIWVLRHGGSVSIASENEPLEIRASEQLPSGQVQLLGIDLTDCRTVHYMRFRSLEHASSLRRLRLDKCIFAGGPEVWKLEGLISLEELGLADLTLTVEEFKRIASLPRLKVLHLEGSSIDDAGLNALHDCITLTELDITGTKVSPEAVNRFRVALPQCEVHYTINE